MSEEEPVVRVHYEIHLHEDDHTEPICPLNDRNMEKLTQELDLTAEEQAKVREIQDTDDLREYLEKIPRDYDVTIVIDEHSPGSPNVTFSPENAILGDEMAIIRRESVGSVKKVKNRRKKKKYRRPETDLSAMPVEEPRASWLELFYDLLYVANLTEFTHSHPITDKDALTTYIGWFVILWWTWAGQTFWAARYDMDDLFTKMLKLVEFWALISFGSFSSDHLHRTVNGFILSYCVQKLVLIIEYSNVLYWARRNRSTQSVLPLVMHIGTNLSAIVIWGLSSLVHHVRWRYVMWYGSILIEVAVLLIFGRRSSVSFAGSHLPERFALFTIIVLGEIFHKTTPLSQLWAYLHLPLHVCMVLVGTGALDLIRLYQLEHHIKEIPHEPSELDVGTLNSLLTSKSLLPPSRNAAGIDIPFLRMLTSGYAPNLSPNDAVFLSGGGGGETDYELTKQYFMAASGAVFLCNSLLKWINLRTYDKYQRVVYLTRFAVAILVFCLMAVPLDKMTPYALLGMMTGFSVLQVAVDLAVIYFGAYGFVEDIGSWVQSARSSIDLGSMLPSRVGSRAGSMVNVHAFSQLKEHNVSKASVIGASSPYSPAHHQPNSMSTAATIPHNQTSRHLQNQPLLSTLQQQQQALYNMHVNANSLGASGAYGNLAKALSDIKNREKAKSGASDAGQGIVSSPITSATPVTRSPPDSDPAGITSVHRQRPPLRFPVSSYGSYANGGHAGGTSRSFERVLSPHHFNRTSAPTTPTIGNMMTVTSAVPSNSTGTRSATSSLHRGDRLSQLMPLRKNDDPVAHSPPSPTNPSPSLGAAGLQAIFQQGNAK
ncbi:hypothetical protein BGW42_008365 [Actinomortierella wolfii]|nr:hypothetical protein BGW42_008365 [Actinomortierella wolfii]